MENIILSGYEFITVIIPAMLANLIFCLINKKKNVKANPRYILYVFIFVVYIFGILHFTGSGTIFDIKRYGIEFRNIQLNLLPFSDKDIDFTAYGLNILLFMPLGFLLPFIWRRSTSVKYIGIFGAALSLFVEVSQLLNNRRTDVDDLILNTVGAILGFMLYKFYRRIVKKNLSDSPNYKNEAVVYVLAMFLGRFLFFNEFGMAKRLFGF